MTNRGSKTTWHHVIIFIQLKQNYTSRKGNMMLYLKIITNMNSSIKDFLRTGSALRIHISRHLLNLEVCFP